MDRGDMLTFEVDNGDYKDWKHFRALETLTKHNKTEGIKDTGSKMYIVGNVLTKEKKEVLKRQELFIGDFFKFVAEGKAHVADEAEMAILLLTNNEF